MKTFKIYFNDLNEDAQKRLLKEAKVDSPKDVNWFLDIFPIGITPTWLLTGEQDEWKYDSAKHSTKDTLTLRELSDKFFSRHIPDNTSTIYVFRSEKDANNWIEHKYFKEHSMHDYSIFMTIHSDFSLKGIVQERWYNAEVEQFFAVEADTIVAVISI